MLIGRANRPLPTLNGRHESRSFTRLRFFGAGVRTPPVPFSTWSSSFFARVASAMALSQLQRNSIEELEVASVQGLREIHPATTLERILSVLQKLFEEVFNCCHLPNEPSKS